MQTLIVKIDTPENANFLATFLRTVKTVKSVTFEINKKKKLSGKKKAVETESYNWINPTRPATDEDFEQMISESESEQNIPAKEARELTMKKIIEWKKLNLM